MENYGIAIDMKLFKLSHSCIRIDRYVSTKSRGPRLRDMNICLGRLCNVTILVNLVKLGRSTKQVLRCVRQWAVSSWFGQVGHCTVRYCTRHGLERFLMPPEYPRVSTVRHVHSGWNALTVMSLKNMGLTWLNLIEEIKRYLAKSREIETW